MFKTSVQKIVAGFQKTIDQLDDHEQSMVTRVANIDNKIHELNVEADECAIEARMAATISSKLNAIIGKEPVDV